MKNKTCKKNRGFSLLELLLSIAIISLIILMATRYFTTVRSSQQVSAAISMVQGVRAGVATQLANGGAITATAICTAKEIPASYCDTTTNKLIGPWDTKGAGASDVATSTGGYTVTVASVPDNATCTKLSSAFSAEATPGTCAASGATNLTLAFTS